MRDNYSFTIANIDIKRCSVCEDKLATFTKTDEYTGLQYFCTKCLDEHLASHYGIYYYKEKKVK